MISRRIIMGVAVTGAATAAMLGAAVSASAATPVPNIVSVNGSTTPAGAVAVKGVPTGTLTLTSSTGAVLSCPASSTLITGSANNGSNSSGTAATIPASGVKFGSATYSGAATGTGTITPGSAPCTAAGGSVPVAVKSCSTWAVQTTGGNGATTPVQGTVTPGQIAGICADIYVGTTNSCYTRVSGLVSGNYTNNATSGALKVDPNLTSTLVGSNTNNPSTGCVGGALKNGTTYKFSGTFNVTTNNSAAQKVWVDA